MKTNTIFGRVLALMLAVLALALPATAFAEGETAKSITCYGEDLSAEQYQEVMKLLGADLSNDTMISVTIDDEKALLTGLVEEEKMGSKSISCARVTPQQAGAGISVSTQNINWVTANMYASALSTAGVTDAKIVVAAPKEVSGTAALAGIFKAYESATNTMLSEASKLLAGQEMVTLGSLADQLGTKEAEDLISMAKKYALDNGLTDPAKAKPMVLEYAKQLGVALTDDQANMVTNLLIKIVEQDMSAEEIAAQLNNLNSAINKFEEAKQATATFFEKVKVTFTTIGEWFTNLFKPKQ